MAEDDPLKDTQIVDVSDSFEDEDVESLVGKTIAGKYEIVRRIARGGMGVVYLAEHKTLGRSVVFKVLSYHLSDDDKAKSRFEREARGLSVLEHPNVVTVHDFGYDAGLTYIVMEYVHGENLSQRVRGSGRIRYEELLPIMLQTIDAIAAAHDKEIIHRDIKPSNVMTTTRAGRHDFVKVLDFGLAKLAHSSVDITKGNLVGTVSYLAPEVIQGDEATPASDVYSLGVMFYYLFAGKKPFEGDDDMSVLYQHVNDPPPPLADAIPVGEAPPEFLRFIHRCMAKDPAVRPKNGAQMRQLLGELVTLPKLSAFSVDSSTALPRLERDSSADRKRPMRRTRPNPAPASGPDATDATLPSIAKARSNRWARIAVVAFTTFSLGVVGLMVLKSSKDDSDGEERDDSAIVAPSETPEGDQGDKETVARFTIESTPSGEVRVDGEPRGTSPLDLELSAGSHEIAVSTDGYQTWSRSIAFEAGERRRIDVFLTQAGSDEDSRAETTVTAPPPRQPTGQPDPPEIQQPPDKPSEKIAERADTGAIAIESPDAGSSDSASESDAPEAEESAEKPGGLLNVDEKPGDLLPVE